MHRAFFGMLVDIKRGDEKLDFKIGQIFEGKYPPEAAVWCNEQGNCYIDKVMMEGKAVYQIVTVPEPSLEELKTIKLEQLSQAQSEAEKRAHIFSSVGFEIDANDRASRDISGLLVTTKETDTVNFCDYHNQLNQVSRAQLKAMQEEIIQNAQYIYQQKWAYREAINAATTVEELNAIEIEFKYLDIYEDVNLDDVQEG